MSERNDGGPAFPLQFDPSDFPDTPTGMSLRDWFAGRALNSVLDRLAGEGILGEEFPGVFDMYAEQSYKLADAMLAARNEGDKS